MEQVERDDLSYVASPTGSIFKVTSFSFAYSGMLHVFLINSSFRSFKISRPRGKNE